MKVLMNEAIQDPTKLEEKIRSDAQKRLEKHIKENEARKLTKEQKREKTLRKQEENEKMGIHVAAFK